VPQLDTPALMQNDTPLPGERADENLKLMPRPQLGAGCGGSWRGIGLALAAVDNPLERHACYALSPQRCSFSPFAVV
jgi:hypothetical protein